MSDEEESNQNQENENSEESNQSNQDDGDSRYTKEREGDEESKDEKDEGEKEINHPNTEVPTEIIIFSDLSKEEKIKYFNFFIANDTIFNREPKGTWIAEIDIFEEDNHDSSDLILSNTNKIEDPKKLRQSKFRTTKKDYDTIYSKLIKVINPSPGIKGTKMNLNAIKYMIQEIYSLKFLKDTQALFNKEDVEPESFPVFVGNFLINKFPKKEILHKKAIDFMLSLDFYGLKHKDIKVFQQFVTEEYDADDLIFYLFVRSCIEKEQKIFFLEKAKENLGQDLLYGQENDDILIPVKKCEKLAKAIFGGEEDDLMSDFMENIKKLLETEAADSKKKTLKANSILNMSLVNYQESRGKVIEEEDEDDDENLEEKEEEKKKKKEKDKKHKKNKDEEIEKELKKKDKNKKKPKASYEKENSDDDYNDDEEYDRKDSNEEEDEERINTGKKSSTKLRAQKKNNLKSSSTATNSKSNVGTKTKPSAPASACKNTKTTKMITSQKPPAPKPNTSKPAAPSKTTVATKKNPPVQNKTSTNVTKPGTKGPTVINKTAKKTAQEEKMESNKDLSKKNLKKGPGTNSSSVGKRVNTNSVGKRKASNIHDDNENIEQSQEFKKILNKNRIEKAKSEKDRPVFLLYIISAL